MRPVEMHVWPLIWLSAGEALTSLSCIPIVVMSVARSLLQESDATSTLASEAFQFVFTVPNS